MGIIILLLMAFTSKNKASVSIHVHITFCMCARVLLGAHLRLPLLGHRIYEGTNLERNEKLFSKVVSSIYNPISKVKKILSSHPFKHLEMSYFLKSTNYKMYLVVK